MGDLLKLIDGVVAQLPAFTSLLFGLATLVGLWLVIAAVRDAGRYNDSSASREGVGGPLVKLIVGVFLISFPGVLRSLTQTFLGEESIEHPSKVFSYAPKVVGLFAEGSAQAQTLVAVLLIVQFVGLIAVFRGLLLFNAHYSGIGSRPSFGAAVTHLIGGIAAVNIAMVLGLFEHLIGGSTP